MNVSDTLWDVAVALWTRIDRLINWLQIAERLCWLCGGADSCVNISKMGINICFDMSKMFVSSLWKGDFDNLFTAMCGFKRGRQLSCVHNHLHVILRLSPELTHGRTCNHFFFILLQAYSKHVWFQKMMHGLSCTPEQNNSNSCNLY